MNSRLKVIEGGPGATPPLDLTRDSQRRLLHLHRIGHTLVQARYWPYPVGPLTMARLLVVGLSAILAYKLIGAMLEDRVAAAAVDWGNILLATAVTILAVRLRQCPRSFVEQLDRQLAIYTPIDRRAYQELQLTTRSSNRFEPGEVQRWLSLERQAIQRRSAQAKPRPGFLDRRL
ncbi:hypothetical protein [Azospirillum sp. B4]|uniref:hypothetical protein n=1 Tax=Azospirillum sp. B4 TaxID=95605 RepID=UPI0005C816DA|nr:hypothetical protein [Azospirillum sp. B4]